MFDMNIVKWAEQKSQELLAPLGNRWLHVQGVVKRAYEIKHLFSEKDWQTLIAAAYLHDIGYAPSLQITGFHPLDGAYYLQKHHQERLASLVAYHSEAQFEAQLRGLASELATFPREHSDVADALTYCDMTTNSIGQPVTLQQRLDDIFHRYSKAHIVSQAIHQAQPSLHDVVRRIKEALH
jgi:HD superfamily phosphodiesterase